MASPCYDHDSIELAMAESHRCRFPLIVWLQAKSEDAVSNPSSALTTTDDLSFLPPAYLAARYHTPPPQPTSTATQANANTEHAQLVVQAPAFVALTHAQTNNTAGGFTITPDFPLGTVRGGTAQRIALEATMELTGLGYTSVLLRLVQGDVGFEQFTAAMSALPTGPPQQSPPLPRAYVFTPNTSLRTISSAPGGGGERRIEAVPPLVLFGTQFTPRQLMNVIRASLSMPPDPILMRRQQQLAAAVHGRQQGAGVPSPQPPSASISEGIPTGGQGFAFAWKQSLLADLEAVRGMGVSPTPRAAAAAGTPATTTTKTVVETASVRQREMQVVHVIGLPFQRTKAVFVTTPAMTLRTVWQDVAFTLQRLQKELEECKELDAWETFGCEKGASWAASKPDRATLMDEVASWFTYAATRRVTLSQRTFQLRVLPPAEASRKNQEAVSPEVVEGRLVRTAEEAQRVHLTNLPNGARVQVVFTDPYAAMWPPASAQTEPSTGGVTCDGDVCRRTPVVPSAASADTPAVHTSPSASVDGTVRLAPTPTRTGGVTLRCTLPTGETLTLSDLDVATASLANDVRPAVAARLSHDHFHFVQAYPMRRFRVDEDEARTLDEIDVRTSRALRVVLDEGAPAVHTQPESTSSVTPLARLRNYLTSGSGSARPAAQPAPPAPPRTFHSMREMLDAQEKEENDRAKQDARMEALMAAKGDGRTGAASSSSSVDGAHNPQNLLQRFAQRLRAQQQQESGDVSTEAGEDNESGTSQRYTGGTGGHRLGGREDGSV